MLTYNDVIKLFPDIRGVKVDSLLYETISINSSIEQKKGLFFHINVDSKLNDAIANGAVTAIWRKDHPLPSYTPNHFPVIFVKDPLEALMNISGKYKEKITLKSDGELTTMKLNKQDIDQVTIYNKIMRLLNKMELVEKRERELE
ncbi:hypothetical protein [Pseudogracilibacillus auburnensis]|uniref:hypothetical protein n=1 Tax=Pseudogracilibacillus auburnensis TaxID=1494959 RepID=UPI001A970015|nr:hypothetical protein [Pseudogracilibacillus auburnensis]MBO1004933.1 hypothetical protein [Pseudogracilibacillus auburnensis]